MKIGEGHHSLIILNKVPPTLPFEKINGKIGWWYFKG